MEDILYVYITWPLELFTLRKEIMLTKTGQSLWALTKTGQSLWALTKTGQSLWGLTSSINCFRQYSSKNFGLRYQRPHCRVRIINLSDLCPTKITWSFAHNFFKKNFCWTHVHFFVPIFQTSGDISSGFQSQWAAWFMLDEGIHDIHSLRSTFGVTCLLVCIASIAASHMCASSEVRCRIWTADCFRPELFQSISG